ncbi:MAG: sigma-70 family RNA polymerase sigma factor [Firmicutes bacterium]|nr:sigma-70 family RNA polymerase sigma factor [Bacillota bacterium]
MLQQLLRFAARLYAAALRLTGSRGEAQTPAKTSVNEQAERMLTDYGNAILRLAYSYLHNMDDAEEVLQDTLIRFLKTAPVLESKEHEKAWLLRVAANLSKNRIKYNALRKTDELMEELAADEQNDLAFLWEAVKDLPEKYREVIHLFYHEGYQTAQIAKILNMKEATVRSHLARGREKLKAVLKEAYDFEE